MRDGEGERKGADSAFYEICRPLCFPGIKYFFLFITHSVRMARSLLILPTYFLLETLLQLAVIDRTPSHFLSDTQLCWGL